MLFSCEESVALKGRDFSRAVQGGFLEGLSSQARDLRFGALAPYNSEFFHKIGVMRSCVE